MLPSKKNPGKKLNLYLGQKAAKPGMTLLLNDQDKSVELGKINTEVLINSTEDHIWSVDCDFELIAANQSFIKEIEALTGCALQPGDFFLLPGVLPPHSLAFWKECFKKVLQGGIVKKEVYTPAINNWKESWADISCHPIYSKEIIVGVACYSKNITERKLAEEQVRKSEARLIAAQEVAKVGSWETDFRTMKVEWSLEIYRIFEIEPGSFSGTHLDFLEFVHSEDSEKVNTAFHNSIGSHSINKIEHRIIVRGGREKIVEESWRIVYDLKGQPERAIGTCHDITARRAADERGRHSEEKQTLIMNAALDAIICIDIKGAVSFWNPQAELIFGWSEKEVIGLQLAELIIPVQYRKRHTEGMAHYLKTGKGPALNVLMELSALNKENVEFPIELTIKPIRQGNEEFFCAFIRDITKRKNTEKELQRAYTEKITVLESIDDGFFAVDKNALVTYWNNRAEILLNAKREDVLGKNLHKMFANPDSIKFQDNYRRAIRENTTIHFEEFSKRSNKWFAVSAFPTENGMSVYFKDVTERKVADLRLKESNERYDLISQVTNDMVWDWNLVTGEVYRNKEGWRKLFRTKAIETEAHLINDWDERIHPDDREKVQKIKDEIETSGRDFFETECRLLRDDGTYAYIHDRGHVIRDVHGKAIRLLGATQDITQRKEAELQLVQSELRFRSLVQNSSDLISILDAKGNYMYSSPAAKRILGFEPGYLIGKNAFSFIHPDDVASIKMHLELKKIANQPKVISFRFKNKRNEWTWLESKVTDRSTDPEIMGYVFNSRDVTERKIAEEEIEKLSIIARETVNAVIITDPQEKILWVNEAFTRITEFEPADALGKRPGDFLQGPDTNPAVVRFMRGKIRNQEPFECDIVNYSKYGRKYWLRIQCQPQFDEAGKLKYFFAIETDITQEKEAESILKASEERYRYLFDNNPASICIWDIETLQILEVNKTALQEYGYTREEFLSKSIMDHVIDRHKPEAEAFVAAVREKDDFTSVIISKHFDKAGEPIYMSIASHRIHYKGKKVVLALATNVTEKVYLEKLLEKERVVKQKQITEAVISAQESERQEIGRELHDNINQILASSRLYLNMVKKGSPVKLPYMEETDQLIQTAIREIRSLSHSMISPSLNDSELVEALEHLINVTSHGSSLAICLKSEGFDETLVIDKLKITIYRIVQEQFTNIIKYAGASHIIVTLEQENERLKLSIKDDGQGFDTTKKSTGVGLLNIKTRASLYNGEVDIISMPGEGCELKVKFN